MFDVRATFFGLTMGPGEVCIPVDTVDGVMGDVSVCWSACVFVTDGSEEEFVDDKLGEVSGSWEDVGGSGGTGKASNPDNLEDILTGVLSTVSACSMEEFA